MKSYKKLDTVEVTNESGKAKRYMKELDIRGARLQFKLCCKRIPTVKFNYKNKKDYIQQKWTCEGCVRKTQLGKLKEAWTPRSISKDVNHTRTLDQKSI